MMIVMEDSETFLAITCPCAPVERVPLTQRDILRLLGGRLEWS